MKLAFYKGTKRGIAGLYNIGVRIITKGKYSHCEAVFSDGMSASSSFIDGGVRFKKIDYDPKKWDFIDIDDSFEDQMRDWFKKHDGAPYDILGNIHFLIPVVGDDKSSWCCSEAIAESMSIKDAWRFHPNSLFSIVQSMENFHNNETKE